MKKPIFKSKSIPGLSKEELLKQTDQHLARSQYMKEAHTTAERKEISRLAGIKGTDILREKGYFESKGFLEMVKQNGHNAARKTMENGTGLYGRTPEQKVEDCRLGGSMNTDKQKEARAKQIKIFTQAGTEAAAIAATIKYHAKIEKLIKVLPKGWITINEAEAIKKQKGIKRLNIRNSILESKYFTIQKRTSKGQTLKFKIK